MGEQKQKQEQRLKMIHQKANAWMVDKMPKMWAELEEVLASQGLVITEEQAIPIQKWLGKNLALTYAMGVNNQNEKKAKILDRFGEVFN